MVAASIDDLKTKFTDQYVTVDAARPELARFRDVVGQVRTVNMSGRALVEFLDFHLNIGWHDIDVSALTVVPKPAPTEPAKEKKAEAKKPAGEAGPAAKPAAATAGDGAVKKLSPLEMARMQGSGGAAAPAKPAAAKPAGEKKSVADVLAAARNKTAAAAAPTPAAPPAPAPPKPAPAQPAAAPASDAGGSVKKIDKSKMSLDDMLAYARRSDAK